MNQNRIEVMGNWSEVSGLMGMDIEDLDNNLKNLKPIQVFVFYEVEVEL